MHKLVFILLPFAFDFRGLEESGGAFQYSLFACVVLASFIFISMIKTDVVGINFRFFNIGFIFSIFISVINSLLRDVNFGNHLRVLSVYVLVYIGFRVGYLLSRNFRIEAVFDLLRACFLISGVFSFAYGLVSTGQSLIEIRFQILTPVLLPAFGYFSYKYVSSFRFGWIDATTYVFLLGALLISMTRSAMLGWIGVVVYVIWLLPKPERRDTFSFLFKTSLGILILGFASLFIPSEFYERLFERFLGSYDTYGYDVTTLSRLAEVRYQLDALFESFGNFLFGLGLGAPYSFSEEYFQDLASVTPLSELQSISWWAVGHNFWIYSLFAQGSIIGLFIPGSLLFFIFKGSIVFRTFSKIRPIGEDGHFLGLGLVLLIGILLTTIGGNPMGPRYSSLMFGLALGLVAYSLDFIGKKQIKSD